MANFKYKVRDKSGRLLSGAIAGDSREAVSENLKKMGYTTISVEESSDISLEKISFARFRRVKLDDLVMFTRQLVTLQSAGLPILMSLGAIKEQTESKVLKNAIIRISADIESGLSFSEALIKHPRIFDHLYVNMVKAGEASGMLDEVLERLASLSEYQMETNAKIRSATIYPIIVLATLVGAFLVIVTFVLPRFGELFASVKVELPLPTRILLAVNYLIRHYWHLLAAAAVISIFIFRSYISTPWGRLKWDEFKLKVPVFGPLILKITMSRFAHITAALIKSAIPLMQVLELSSKTAGNAIVSRSLDRIRQSVSEGKPMNEAMRQDKIFPPIVTQMVAVGENTGKLDQLLSRISNYFDSQVDYMLKNLTTAIEPLLIFCLGIMVLVMALAIFLPMWNMIQVFRR